MAVAAAAAAAAAVAAAAAAAAAGEMASGRRDAFGKVEEDGLVAVSLTASAAAVLVGYQQGLEEALTFQW